MHLTPETATRVIVTDGPHKGATGRLVERTIRGRYEVTVIQLDDGTLVEESVLARETAVADKPTGFLPPERGI